MSRVFESVDIRQGFVRAIVACIGIGCGAIDARGQAMPLRPYRWDRSRIESNLLRIRVSESDTSPTAGALREAHIVVKNRVLWLMSDSLPWQRIDLNGISIASVADQLRSRYPGLLMSSDHPDAPALLLASKMYDPIGMNGVDLTIRSDRFSATTEFGLVLQLRTSFREDDQQRLLDDTGLQTDLVGQFVLLPGMRLRPRLGLRISGDLPTAVLDSAARGTAFLTPAFKAANQLVTGAELTHVVHSTDVSEFFVGLNIDVGWENIAPLSKQQIRDVTAAAIKSVKDPRISIDSIPESAFLEVQRNFNRPLGLKSYTLLVGLQIQNSDQDVGFVEFGLGQVGQPAVEPLTVVIDSIKVVDPTQPQHVSFRIQSSRRVAIVPPSLRFAAGVRIGRLININVAIDKPSGRENDGNLSSLVRFQLMTEVPLSQRF